ncbi:uncharacterized protein DNG_08852 [Cephalotrichum gorgonifer]|uniref:RPEL repeat protein n=1 Tax=Cephalotrichum gorgonifer TaxID=2041049 RepID=A0AAE8SYX4_9PEZI|nr:uncharacterized protein DNG_08852 [Cephalotrichum gorgonifer]
MSNLSDLDTSRSPPTHRNIDETPISPVQQANPERRNSLEHHLQHRPGREDLIEKNILPDTSAAPALQAHQVELKKHMLADTLNEKIAHRPDSKELVEEGVLSEDPLAARRRYEEAMEDEYAKREGGA